MAGQVLAAARAKAEMRSNHNTAKDLPRQRTIETFVVLQDLGTADEGLPLGHYLREAENPLPPRRQGCRPPGEPAAEQRPRFRGVFDNQIVLEADDYPRRTRVALPPSTPEELPVDAPRRVPVGEDHVKPAAL